LQGLLGKGLHSKKLSVPPKRVVQMLKTGKSQKLLVLFVLLIIILLKINQSKKLRYFVIQDQMII
jgi:hypothetical protein